MIDVSVKIHDKYQLEIKLNYEFEKDKKITEYKMESFIFVPNSLGINYSTYKKDDFYNDLQSYIRIKTPVYLINKIVDFPESPLNRLKAACEKLAINPDEVAVSEYEYQIKMFSCIVKSSVRDYANFIKTKTNPEEIKDLMTQYTQSTQSVVESYRGLRQILNVPTIHEDIYSIFLYGDEYLSLLTERYNFRLLEYLKEMNIDLTENVGKRLQLFIQQEIIYRRSNGYDSVAVENTDNETIIFRYSVLKKYLESVLFIDTSKRQDGQLLEQFLVSTAAGLAMLFATTIAFWGHYVYGNYTFPIFITLIISYMFKDRIKELTRIYFTSKILKLLHDHRIKIFIDKKIKIGDFRESFNFLKKRKVTKAILKIRNLYRTKEFDNKFSKESILFYQKKIELYTKRYKNNYYGYQISGINDILRLNISRFLNKMDNPNKPIFILSPEGYKKGRAKRVYHMNMIIKCSVAEVENYVRYRIVLTRHGIKRIEQVTASGRV